MAMIIDGKSLAQKIRQSLREKTETLKAANINTGLAVILVGNDPASAIYVRNKKKDCEDCGILSFTFELPETIPQDTLLALIDELNDRSDVHGILLQLPLPAHINEKTALKAINPEKDVDMFHPENVGLLVQGAPRFMPCTPAGIMTLLDEYGIDPKGKECVVVGRSDIVGKPTAIMLMHRHGTVTIAHSRTKNLAEVCRRADILVAAAGKAGLVTADMVKPGAVVIDVAMNRNAEGKLTGDVVFSEVSQIASYITPVPGGVGPMTRAILMKNTVSAAERSLHV